MAEDSPTSITHVLKGIHMPVDKKGLLEHARKNHAGKPILDDIQAMPDGEFHTMADVMKAFGQSH